MAGPNFRRIVHLDLKGAPPKISFLEKVLDNIKTWGASGVLIEWEDTFPYENALKDIGSLANSSGDGMYTKDEVMHIQRYCYSKGLEVIQLVQTIGHMEYVLKHPQFKRYRESEHSPAVLCPLRPGAQQLVREMVSQVLDTQYNAKYVHIGADEVWHLGVCDSCKKRAEKHPHGKAALFLEHVRNLVRDICEWRPDIIVLMWDDMLRTVPIDTLMAYDLYSAVQPVLWNYSVMETYSLELELLEKYRRAFYRVWAGSAFKGANGSATVLSPVVRYVSNQEAWRRVLNSYEGPVRYKGIILTGWSRFDHYATLCELLPVSLPCLANCLNLLNRHLNFIVGHDIKEMLPESQWPGIELAMLIHTFVMMRDRTLGLLHGDILEGVAAGADRLNEATDLALKSTNALATDFKQNNRVTTWLNPWQVENNYTNPLQLDAIVLNAKAMLKEWENLQPRLLQELNVVTGKRSSDEWIGTFVMPLLEKLRNLIEKASTRAGMGAGVRPLSLENTPET